MRQGKVNPLAVILGLSSLFFIIFVIFSATLFVARNKSAQAPTSSRSLFKKAGKVGVVELAGVIMDSKRVVKEIDVFDEDKEIAAVVIHINSPGGAVAPSQEIYEAIKRLDSHKPVVASMGSVAASGAFYSAMGARKIYANAGTITGSIGVIMDFVNLEKLYEWAKIKRYSLKTGKHKAAGADYEEMSPESKALLQEMLLDVLDQFKTAVMTGRKLPRAEVDAVADGRVFSGTRALKIKMVDAVGTFHAAIEDAAKLGGITGKPKVVYPDRNRHGKLLEYLVGDDDDEEDADSSYRGGGVVRNMIQSNIREVLGAVLGVNLGSGDGKATAGGAMPTTLPAGVYWLWKDAS